MKLFRAFTLIFSIFLIGNCKNPSIEPTSSSVTFKEGESKFTSEQKQLIHEVVLNSESKIRTLLPKLPDSIEVVVEIVDWDIEVVGGVTGRTETNSPPQVVIQISNTFPGGLTKAIHTALKNVIFHEFHHLYRGWAIKDNTFEQGIDIAAVNEGLAIVFSEKYTGQAFEADSAPEEDTANRWAKEIMALPKDANYQHWMFEHPDGRLSIGYRTGNFLIGKAMAKSGKSVIELSENTPDEILRLAGY